MASILLTALTNSKTLAIGQGINVTEIAVDNTANNATTFLQCFNSATTTGITIGSTTPYASYPIAASQVGTFRFGQAGKHFSAGIVVAATTSATNSTAPGSNVTVQIDGF